MAEVTVKTLIIAVQNQLLNFGWNFVVQKFVAKPNKQLYSK